MKKLAYKIVSLWKAETPLVAKWLQFLSVTIAGAVGALAVFWTSIPDDWKTNIPAFILNHLVYIGGVATVLPFIIQLFKKNKEKKNE